MKYIGHDKYLMESGREFYANNGLIGLCPESLDKDDWIPSEGYDGHIFEAREFTKEERVEMADFMIKQWELWKVATLNDKERLKV